MRLQKESESDDFISNVHSNYHSIMRTLTQLITAFGIAILNIAYRLDKEFNGGFGDWLEKRIKIAGD